MIINTINYVKLYPQLLCAKVENVNEMDDFLNKCIILHITQRNQWNNKNNIGELKNVY